ncbi:Protein of unknown function [Noviherbaspirillum humi]|uniref:DUF3106 domain-containing protein n=1 Tax=Noviherbaspirillum humi TaxID=1688639 RepID=A0A239KSH9_9BURK|nr:DUF3106 domain-containing protein [Noviherbaspirillum humi]SNT21000.1 Protein of unknown function [Noviherbaspirillum humi]
MAKPANPKFTPLAKTGAAVGFLSVVASLTFAAAEGSLVEAPKAHAASPSATPIAPVSTSPAAPATKPQVIPANVSRPAWQELSPAQQTALAPLATEWDRMDANRKAKWLKISKKYASMTPDEQQRLQERMREWVKLTPEQRRVARESFAMAKQLKPDQKSEKWQEYQQLPEEQKKKLAADAAMQKKVATLPPPSQAKPSAVSPIKATPRPVIEQSANPQVVPAIAPVPASSK